MASAVQRLILVNDTEIYEKPDLIGDVVSIQVSDKLFHIHVAVLTRSSKFFENAMKSEWRTDSTKPIDMSTTDPQTFEYYCQWLYTRQIRRLYDVSPSDQLAHLYVLGEHIMDTVFQDVIADTFIRRYKEFSELPDMSAIKILYAGTATNSPVRRLMVDIWALGASLEQKPDDITEKTCVEFVNDLIPALLKRRPMARNKFGSIQPGKYRCGNDAAKKAKESTSASQGAKRKRGDTTLEQSSASSSDSYSE